MYVFCLPAVALAHLGSACSVYPWRHKKSQRMACIDSRMLSTTVACPCQTLRELAGDHEETHTSSPSQIVKIFYTPYREE